VPYVYDFDHAHDRPPRELKELLGGKGANLAEMTSVLDLPVPPGFTVSTDACRACLKGGWPEGLTEEVAEHLATLESRMGKRLGDPSDPLLVSVRSGAASSMPGMMDTVLNLGLNEHSVEGLAKQTDDEAFAQDSYRRFLDLYRDVVLGDDEDAEVPQDPHEQLRQAIEAVFRSWTGPRAVAYRTREHIPHDLGTAVNVQAMVFGNRDDRSGTGVGFTRDPATGAQGVYGDFLVNAQGEDVVAGTRITKPLSALEEEFPDVYAELMDIFERLERHYRDMLDTEFTIEQGKLWMLQTRVGKRTGAAALKQAVAMTTDPGIELTHEEALLRVSGDNLDQVLHPQFAPGDHEIVATGLPASPGAAVGKAQFTADAAVTASRHGDKVILVRSETSPDDVHGLEVAEGVLTSKGGLVSHAAVVARGWGKPAVVGAEAVEIEGSSFTAGGVAVQEGDVISIDGTTGEVAVGEVELAEGEHPPEFEVLLGWADEARGDRLGVWANADTAHDAAQAREYGAEGIGLCRTEHMFLGDRLPLIQRLILADGDEEERPALAELGDVQREDFEAILEAMDGLPVTVRLLDPPLHEFLPDLEELIVAEAKGELDEGGHRLLDAARHWQETNPMLGTRGVRLAVVKDGLYRMQVKALMEAAVERARAGGSPIVEVMIPLVVSREELALARGWVEEEVEAVRGEAGVSLEVKIGTMIETPRAALLAEEIAEAADFFSFGTNDLTQMTYGFSRDDIEGRLMAPYLEQGLLARDPFETLDLAGVGELVRLGVERGRVTKPDLKVGVCGEHGGDPESIDAFFEAGVDYVSCSPFRVPVARLAGAQAVVRRRAA